jgi:hypothetical protein
LRRRISWNAPNDQIAGRNVLRIDKKASVAEDLEFLFLKLEDVLRLL